MLWIKIRTHSIEKRRDMLYVYRAAVGGLEVLEMSEEHGDFKTMFMNPNDALKSYFQTEMEVICWVTTGSSL
jgi:hypothetical protein